MNDPPKLAFVSGYRDWWRRQALAAKYLRMRLQGLIYPDVYCLPLMLADGFRFITEGEPVRPGSFDLIFAELQSSESRLHYLESLALAGDPPLVIIPGPPEILARDLTDGKLHLVRKILGSASYVLAYSQELKAFCDGLIGSERSELIPWPYDIAITRRVGESKRKDRSHRHSILVQLPLRFCEVTQNYPFLLKSILLDIWQELPDSLRRTITLHTFVYTPGDLEAYRTSRFAVGLPFVLETRRGYQAFLKFLGQCDGVINLTAGGVLGRITFAAAALNRPGIFSDNSECNRRLYPQSCVALFDTVRLRDLVRAMFLGLASGNIDQRLLADCSAAEEIGDFKANQARLQQIFRNQNSAPRFRNASVTLPGNQSQMEQHLNERKKA